MTLLATVVLPAAPLVLTSASPAQPAATAAPLAALRADVAVAAATLDGAAGAVLLVGGERLGVQLASSATLASYGLPDVHRTVAVDAVLARGVADALGVAAPDAADRYDGDPAVLALHLGAAAPTAALLVVSVPVDTAPQLTAWGRALARCLAAFPTATALVAAGDLAATREITSPGHLQDGAVAWDDAACAAVAACDRDAFAALGPAEARRVQARGWAPLAAMLAVLDTVDRPLGTVRFHAPRGVGQLVAW